jgi:hypothetical protein
MLKEFPAYQREAAVLYGKKTKGFPVVRLVVLGIRAYTDQPPRGLVIRRDETLGLRVASFCENE